MEEKFQKFSKKRIRKYEKTGYRIVGKNKHSAIEICRWTKSRIKGKRNCYKKVFGISSDKCIQITPALDCCHFSCQFCWRAFGDNRLKSVVVWDKPKELVDNAIKAQKEILSGFGGSKYVTSERFKEAMKPLHFALSLDGEPTIYPYLANLIKEIKSRGFSVFLVTNGVLYERLKELLKKNAIPDNLSISVYATSEKDYKKTTNSFVNNPLEKIKKSLALMRKFENCRTNFRMTLVKDLNLYNPKGYSKLIKIANPKFVTLKGYTYIGASQKRLKLQNMPFMHEIENFAEKIKKGTNYMLMHKDVISRVIILAKDRETLEWNKKKIKEQVLRHVAKSRRSAQY